MFQLSLRLKTIAHCVVPFKNVIDVGTDHCFVPIYLVLNHLVDGAIGTDINSGPVNEARKNIESFDLSNCIEARMGNGLESVTIHDQCDCIVIAGMGGRLITGILNTGSHILHLNKRLVLQPNLDANLVRIWLCENHYEIVSELIIEEDGIFYEIIVADKRNNKFELSDLELKYGPIFLKEKPRLFIKKYQILLNHKKHVFEKVPEYHENKKLILDEINEIASIL